MSEFLLYYRRPDPTTWVYMSSFLTIGLFFIFRRFWSIRNLDIVLLILLAPGLLMVNEGYRRQTRLARQQLTAASVDPPIPKASNRESVGSTDLTTAAPAADPNSEPGAELLAGVGPESELDLESRTEGESGLESGPESGPGDDRQEAEIVPLSPEQYEASVSSARRIQRGGFIALFLVQMLLLVRLLLDPLMVRRPLLDPNLTTGGLNFIGISLFIFMMANVVASTPEIQQEQGPKLGPGYALMNMLPAIPTRPVSEALAGAEPPRIDELSGAEQRRTMIAKVIAILAQSAVLIAILLIGNRHYGNLRAGAGCATLYLLMPYTAQMTGRVDHVVPAALLLWAVLLYRKPMAAGVLVGAAAGLVYYPLFLLPLWFSFYWPRGARRFAVGVSAMLAILMCLLAFAGGEPFLVHLRWMFGLFFPIEDPRGIWELGWYPAWRLPVIAAFVILSALFAAWPAQKNLGTLISCSAAVMVATQFWHSYGGGLYMAWFLPLVLLTIFRPNLQDRVALKVIDAPAATPTRAPLEMDAA